MKLTTYAILILAAASCLRAQSSKPQGLTSQPNQTDSALTAETRRVFQTIEENTIKAAREMPEASYNFTPINGVRTFGELIVHIANVQSTLCSNINGNHAAKAAARVSKDSNLKDLENSVRECQTAFDELSAENASKMVQTPAGELTHLAALVYIITHASEEYGQLAIYLRLTHLTPPTSDQLIGTI
jgi:uncharacterized damage-inducible protein DinB